MSTTISSLKAPKPAACLVLRMRPLPASLLQFARSSFLLGEALSASPIREGDVEMEEYSNPV
jgi:hypothetical protein